MADPLQVLIIEDSEIDAELTQYHLEKAGYQVRSQRVETAQAMRTALSNQGWEIIISDYSLPSFSAPAALAVLQESGLDIPFIVISGTITEDTAIDLMRSGAADYLMKDRLARLGVLVKRELNISRVRREHDEAQVALQKSEDWSNLIYNSTSDAMFLLAVEPGNIYRCLSVNKAYLRSTGLMECDVVGKRADDVLSKPVVQYVLGKYQEAIRLGLPILYEESADLPRGCVTVETTLTPIFDQGGHCTHLLGSSHEITDRKREETGLKKSAALLNDTQRLSHVGGWEWDVAKQTMIWSEETYRIHGFSPNEVLAYSADLIQSSLACYDAEDRPIIEAAFGTCIAQGKSYELDLRFTSAHGEKKWIRTMGKAITEGGLVVRVMGNIVDLTEQKLAELSLRKSEELYRQIVDTAQEGIWLLDAEENTTFVNKKMQEMLGTTADDMTGRPFLSFMDDQAKEKIEMDFKNRLEGVIELRDFRFRRKDGTDLWANFSMSPLASADEKKPGTLVLISDTTLRNQAEEALKESRDKLEWLFNVLPVGISVLDQDKKLVKSNPALGEILGITNEGLLRGNYHKRRYLRPDGSLMPAVEFASSRVDQGEKKVDHVETGVEKEDGSIIWTDVSAAVCGFPDWHTVIATVDITRSVETEKKNRQLLEQLRQQNQEQETIIKLTSHLREAQTSDEAQKILVEKAIEIFMADAAGLVLISNGSLIISAASGKWKPWQGSFHLKYGEPLKEILRSGHPRFLNLQEDINKIFQKENSAPDQIGGMVSCALVPIHSGNAAVGLLVIGNYSKKNLLEKQTNLLVTMAEIAGITIQRMKTMESTERLVLRRTNELSALYNVISASSQTKVLKERLDMALEEVLNSLTSSNGGIFLFDKEKNRLISIAEQMPPSELKEVIENAPFETTREGWVFAQEEALIIPDISTDQRFINPVPQIEEQKQVYIGVPIRSRERIIGVLSILRKGEEIFSIDEITFISALANHIGVIIENNNLIEQVERAALLEERSRLARELHDSVTQTLYSAAFFAEAGRDVAEQGNLDMVKEYLARLSQISQQALKEMRLLIYQLRPEILIDEGLVQALRQRLELVENKVAVQTKLTVNQICRLSNPVEDTLYWTAIEALNNIMKHARASQISIHLEIEERRATLTIQDNGKGFDHLESTNLAGMGLNNMRERLQKEGGSLEISSIKGIGTTLTAICPLVG